MMTAESIRGRPRSSRASAQSHAYTPSPKGRKRPGQRNRAYELLRRTLTLRLVPEGQRLHETDWTQRLGVNRAALREALGRLCAEGLVAEGRKGGYFVVRLSTEEIEEVMEVRIMLETGAIARICRLGLNKPSALKRMQELCEELEWVLCKGYSLDLAVLDRRFHEALIDAAGSRRLTSLYRCVPPAGVPAPPDVGTEWDVAAKRMLEQHRAILASLRNADAAAAQQSLRHHLATPLPSTPAAPP